MPCCRALTHEDEPGAGQPGPLEEGVEHVLPLALQLVQLVQHQQAAGRGEPRSAPALPTAPAAPSPHPEHGEPLLGPPPLAGRARGVEGETPRHPPGSETHTMGPCVVRRCSSLRRPSRPAAAGSPSCCATAGKTPCGLLSAMQFRTMVLLLESSSCRGQERYPTGHPLPPRSALAPPASPPFTFPCQSGPPAPPNRDPHPRRTLQSSRTRLRQAVFPVPGAPEM